MMRVRNQTDPQAELTRVIKGVYPKAGSQYLETLLTLASSSNPDDLMLSASDPKLHLAIALNPLSPPEALSEALKNPELEIKRLAAAHAHAPSEALETLLKTETNTNVLMAAIGNVNTPYGAAEPYLESPYKELRKAAASRAVANVRFAALRE